ncbi:MAG TPA: glycosyltransferase [Jatrophihabitans sp.]|jgi:GT2 family glycosyltransferase
MTYAPPTVSVVVCAYTERRWDDLHTACTTADEQLHDGDQLLLVVDHNDTLLDRARDLLPGVEVLANTHQRGLSGARNTALEKVTGEIVVFLDDDAVPRAGWLDALRAPYRDPQVFGVGGWAVPAWPHGDRPEHLPPELDWVVGCSYRGLPETAGPVRNLMGCNMSLRREVFDLVGGFDESIGRVGTTPLGCEETQLCIRLRQARPDVELLLEPSAVVDHTVSADRLTWSYLLRRSYAEGVSKALIGTDVGSDAMTSELAYTRRVLPAAVLRELIRLARGDRGAAGAAVAVPATLAGFGAGYLTARVANPVTAPVGFTPVHVGEIDVADVTDHGLVVPDACGSARLVVRRGPDVLGLVQLPVRHGRVNGTDLRTAIAEVPRTSTAPTHAPHPSAGVVIATAGRPAAAERCVASLLRATVTPDEIVLVDNAPHRTDDALRELAASDARITYLAEPVPGASRARNSGVAALRTDIVATVDDDVVVDRHWLQNLLAEFADDATTMVTGLVQPLALDTEAQLRFEELGGFGKGLDRRLLRADDTSVHPLFPYAPGMVGSGNNLALRRDAWTALGGMSVELGPGTAVPSGEDLDLFLRHLLAGRAIVYTPHALVWHEHRRTEDELVRQLHDYGLGLSAVFTKLVRDDPRRMGALARRVGPGLRRLIGSSRHQSVTTGSRPPRTLRRAELRGFAAGPLALRRARREAGKQVSA